MAETTFASITFHQSLGSVFSCPQKLPPLYRIDTHSEEMTRELLKAFPHNGGTTGGQLKWEMGLPKLFRCQKHRDSPPFVDLTHLLAPFVQLWSHGSWQTSIPMTPKATWELSPPGGKHLSDHVRGEFQIEADASSASYFHAVILGFLHIESYQNWRILAPFYHAPFSPLEKVVVRRLAD